MIRSPRVPRALFEWLTLPRSAAIIVLVGGGYAYLAWSTYRRSGMEGLGAVVAWSPLVAFLLAAPAIGFVAGYFGWVEERTWEPWQGIYHAFDDHQIRVTEARDLLWFSSDDVHTVLGLSPRPGALKALHVTQYRHDEALGALLSNAGLVALFGRSLDRKTLRLVAWAERDVRKPWQNRRDDVTVAYAARRPSAENRASPPAAPPAPSPAPVFQSRSRPIDR